MTAKRKTSYQVTDLHAAGEPVRIITDGAPKLTGASLLAKRQQAIDRYDGVRQLLMFEPRGHADMYGVWPTEADAPGCALAVLFMHNAGYSTMCGHATIALGRWVIDQGIVAATPPLTQFTLQCPCGPVNVRVETTPEGNPGEVTFDSVPAFAATLDTPIRLNNDRVVSVDLAYGGAYYAILPASRLGMDLTATPVDKLIAMGRQITAAGREQLTIQHPGEAALGFLYGCILTDDAGPPSTQLSRNLCIFGGGQVDRSATGSGITARLALAHARQQAKIGETFTFAGLSGVPFQGQIESIKKTGEVIVSVTGKGFYSGESRFWLEADDPLPVGFSASRTRMG